MSNTGGVEGSKQLTGGSAANFLGCAVFELVKGECKCIRHRI